MSDIEVIRDCERCGKQPTTDLNFLWVVSCDCGEGEPAPHGCAINRDAAIRGWNSAQRDQAIENGKCTRCTHDMCEGDSDICRACRIDAEIGTTYSRAAAARRAASTVVS